MCQSASRVKLIHGLSSACKVEDLWTTRLATAYCHRTPFSLIVVALSAMQNSSHLISSIRNKTLSRNSFVLGEECDHPAHAVLQPMCEHSRT